MQANSQSPIFDRGQIYDPADPSNSGAPNVAPHSLGREFEFLDINLLDTTFPGPGPKPIRSGFNVRCRLMKNTSGVTLAPKTIVTWDRDNPGNALALAAAGDTGSPVGVVDEYLPSSGVPANAYFWMVVEGRSLCRTSNAVSGTSITVGMFIVAATGGFANGSGTFTTLGGGAVVSATLTQIRYNNIESRTAYTGSAASADITVWVHKH